MCLIAGGNWNNGSNAGPWALNFWNARSNSNANNGLRADSDSPRMPQGKGGAKGGVFRRDAQASAKSVRMRHFGRAGNGLEGLAT